jgi:hypothetical protein
MKNIHVIPTEKPSRVIKDFNNKLLLTNGDTQFLRDGYQFQNIYITSDENKKIGDYVYDTLSKSVLKITNSTESITATHEGYFKVILTTDQDLIKDGVQDIDDEFLKWFVKNPNYKDVEVVEELNMNGKNGLDRARFIHKIIIPKEEPKTNLEKFPFPELVKEFAEYYKNIPLIEESKQETLEEAAKKYATNHGMMAYVFPEKEKSFIEGAKWQQERMYSEIDLREAFENGLRSDYYSDFDKWFEQVKKK